MREPLEKLMGEPVSVMSREAVVECDLARIIADHRKNEKAFGHWGIRVKERF
ncbi:MAG: hypothetical protein JWL84_1262 [Rhodospirillales bacterium]|nr:hypothetical protein [Rhodospirillales bacterium]